MSELGTTACMLGYQDLLVIINTHSSSTSDQVWAALNYSGAVMGSLPIMSVFLNLDITGPIFNVSWLISEHIFVSMQGMSGDAAKGGKKKWPLGFLFTIFFVLENIYLFLWIMDLWIMDSVWLYGLWIPCWNLVKYGLCAFSFLVCILEWVWNLVLYLDFGLLVSWII